jgi:signal transduction histidine kinase
VPEDVATDVLRRQLERERSARREAEAITERVTGQFHASSAELERLNSELRGANDELRNLNQALRDFVAVASHDLRGPLTSILGIASTLNARWMNLAEDKREEFLVIIERQARHLSRLVEDLLTVSRIEAGELDTHKEVVGLCEAVDRIIKDFGRDPSELRVRADDCEVLADPDHLQRILINYLENAFKYGSPPVEVSFEASGEWVDISVCDHGEGVPEDFVPRLFGKFARGAGSVGGTGLGLSIVQGLARANGGDAWYRANEPSGSCFGVRLPRA